MRQVTLDCPVCYTAEWTADSTCGQRDYVLPSTFLPPLWSVVYDYGYSQERELPYLAPERAAAYHQTTYGSPAAYTYIHKQGEILIRILPAPNVSTIANILVHGARIPSTIAESESCPLNPVMHDCVVSYAKLRAWEEWEQFDYAMRAREEYEQRLGKARRLLTAVLTAYPISPRAPIAPLPASARDD